MKIKSLIIVSVLVVAFFCFAGFVKAQATDNSALIAQLQAEIQSLMRQIAAIQAQQGTTTTTTPATSWCHTFNTYLIVGSTGTEVDDLWTALSKEGYGATVSMDHIGMGMPDTFGNNTLSTLKQFQKKYGIAQTGTVGSKTRAKLNALYGCTVSSVPATCVDSDSGLNYYVSGRASIPVNGPGTSPEFLEDSCQGNTLTEAYCSNGRVASTTYVCPNSCLNGACVNSNLSVTVTSPNGGEVWKVGETHNITWASSLPQSSSVVIYLSKAGSNYDYTVATNILASLGTYSWTIPATVGGSNTGSISTVGNQWKVMIEYPSSSGFDTSDNYFTIATATPTQPTNVSVSNITVGGILTTQSVAIGVGVQMTATVQPSNATSPAVAWSVINGTGAATINSQGLLNPTSAGTVTVIATAQDGSGIRGSEIVTIVNLNSNNTQTQTSCTPRWDCRDWTSCVNGQQTRNCIDWNSCNTTTNEPPTSQSCTTSSSFVNTVNNTTWNDASATCDANPVSQFDSIATQYGVKIEPKVIACGGQQCSCGLWLSWQSTPSDVNQACQEISSIKSGIEAIQNVGLSYPALTNFSIPHFNISCNNGVATQTPNGM